MAGRAVEAVTRRWRCFLEDKPFDVLSDHAALAAKVSQEQSGSLRCLIAQARWVERLLPFALTFRYIRGEENTVADALSRCPAAVNTITLIKPLWKGLLQMLEAAAELDTSYEAQREKLRRANELKERGRLIVTEKRQLLVPANTSLRTFLLSEAHDPITSGHCGEAKTLERLRERWKWEGDRKDVAEYVGSCLKYQKAKVPRFSLRGTLHPIEATRPGEIISLDFVSKFAPAHETGHQQCLVIADKFSRFTILEGCPLEVSAAQTAAIFAKRVFPIFGFPDKVLSDRGPQFTASLWADFLALIGAKRALAAAHHPQTDGASERKIQELLRMLRTFAAERQEEWEAALPCLEVALNTSVNATTGYSPQQLLMGWKPRTILEAVAEDREEPTSTTASPGEWAQRLKANFEAAQAKAIGSQQKAMVAARRNADRGVREREFFPGDLVLLSTASYESKHKGFQKAEGKVSGSICSGQSCSQECVQAERATP